MQILLAWRVGTPNCHVVPELNAYSSDYSQYELCGYFCRQMFLQEHVPHSTQWQWPTLSFKTMLPVRSTH